MYRHYLAVSLAGLLGACSDDPDNVPERGQWQTTTRVTASVDGIALPHDQFPDSLTRLEKNESTCGEPIFTDRKYQQKELNRRLRGTCEFTSYDSTPTQVIGEGACHDMHMRADYSPAIRLRIDQSPKRYTLALALSGDATLAGVKGRHRIVAALRQEGIRTGDC